MKEESKVPDALSSWRGRIGVGRQVHVIKRSERIEDGIWAVSPCGWAGLCKFVVTEDVTCQKCQEYMLSEKPCFLCKGQGGGHCPICDRIVCFMCIIPVRMKAGGTFSWGCRECAASLVLSGEGERA
jgi:hypothetical protein